MKNKNGSSVGQTPKKLKPSSVVSGAMVRRLGEDGHHCSPDCPFLAKWEHPFWHRTAWCWRNLTDLQWHDYWLADCTQRDADPTREKVRNAGRTQQPNTEGQPRPPEHL
jgi:hypothetical protein